MPPPKPASASAAAAAGHSPAKDADKDSGVDDALAMKIDKLISSRLDKLLEKKLAIATLPKPAKLKANTNAPVGQGILGQLQANAGLDQADEDEDTDDISDADAPPRAAAPTAAAAAAAVAAAAAAAASAHSAKSKTPNRVAAAMLETCSYYPSVLTWVKVTTWTSARNRHECEAIAQAVDALLKENIPKNSLGLEILLRRMSGVHLADQTGEWRVAESVAWNAQGNSLLPREEVRRALKDAEQMKRLTDGASQRSRGGGRQHQQRQYSGNKKKDWSDKASGQFKSGGAAAAGSSAAAASSK